MKRLPGTNEATPAQDGPLTSFEAVCADAAHGTALIVAHSLHDTHTTEVRH